jgi:hypothetical protein
LLSWETVDGKQYLYRFDGRVKKILGPRSAATEAFKEEYMSRRTAEWAHITKMFKAINAKTHSNFQRMT